MGDLISFTYSDDNFVVDDLYLTVSNDYKTQEYIGGKLKIKNSSILENVERLEIKFCYDTNECYEIFDKKINGEGEFSLDMSNVYLVQNRMEYEPEFLSSFENKFYNINLIISISYTEDEVSNYKLRLGSRYILHNHSSLYKI